MSEPMKVALMITGWLAFMAPLLVRDFRRAPRQVNKELAKMVRPQGIALDQGGDDWLRLQLVRRRRSSAVGLDVMLLAATPALILLHDDELVAQAWPAMQFPIALVFGHSVGATLASTRPVAAGRRRVASLRPRALATYTRLWERALLHIHVAAAASVGVAAVAVAITRAVPAQTALFLLLLSSGWLGTLAMVRMFQRRIMRTPPPIDDTDRDLARELLISIAVRDLLRMELLTFIVVTMGVMFYLPAVIDGFMPTVAVLPLYALAGGITLARQARRDRGRPDLEWQFATTTRSTA